MDERSLTNDEWQLLWVLAYEGQKAIEFKGGYTNCWYTEQQVTELVEKLDNIDNAIREKRLVH